MNEKQRQEDLKAQNDLKLEEVGLNCEQKKGEEGGYSPSSSLLQGSHQCRNPQASVAGTFYLLAVNIIIVNLLITGFNNIY